MLPLSIARRWYRAMTTGAIWGIGHGVGAGAVGAAAYFVRGGDRRFTNRRHLGTVTTVIRILQLNGTIRFLNLFVRTFNCNVHVRNLEIGHYVYTTRVCTFSTRID